MGAVAWGLWPTPRFPSPLIKPDVPISGIRLSDRVLTKPTQVIRAPPGTRPTLQRFLWLSKDASLGLSADAAVAENCAPAHMVVHDLIRPRERAIAEVVAPSLQLRIEALPYLRRERKSRAPQSRTRPVVAGRSTGRCGRTAGAGLFYIAASSLSIPHTSAAAETAGPAKRSQTGIHGEASAQPGSARPDVRSGKRIVYQRGGQPSVARAATARARAWVSRNQFGRELCSWNIDSIVCCRTSSLTCIGCWFPIDTSQSERKVRNMRIPPQE